MDSMAWHSCSPPSSLLPHPYSLSFPRGTMTPSNNTYPSGRLSRARACTRQATNDRPPTTVSRPQTTSMQALGSACGANRRFHKQLTLSQVPGPPFQFPPHLPPKPPVAVRKKRFSETRGPKKKRERKELERDTPSASTSKPRAPRDQGGGGHGQGEVVIGTRPVAVPSIRSPPSGSTPVRRRSFGRVVGLVVGLPLARPGAGGQGMSEGVAGSGYQGVVPNSTRSWALWGPASGLNEPAQEKAKTKGCRRG